MWGRNSAGERAGRPRNGAARHGNGPRRGKQGTSKRPEFAALAASLSVSLAPAAVCPAHAGDPAAGREAAAQCRACHGIDGLGRMPNVPNIAGQNELYLTNQLEAFRSGARKAPQMSVIAAGLSDENIRDLAAWYASIEISVELPE